MRYLIGPAGLTLGLLFSSAANTYRPPDGDSDGNSQAETGRP